MKKTTFLYFWEKSLFRDKITIGSHQLDDYGVGKTHNSRYLHSKTNHYDGIYYYGPQGSKEYTQNLASIIVETIKDKAICQRNIQLHQNSQPSVATENRFSALTEGNF